MQIGTLSVMANAEAPMDTINRFFELYNQRKWDDLAKLAADDLYHEPNAGLVERGRAAFRRYLDRNAACCDETLAAAMVMKSANGAHVVVEFVAEGTYIRRAEGFPRAHGQRYVIDGLIRFELRDDRIARLVTYYRASRLIEQLRDPEAHANLAEAAGTGRQSVDGRALAGQYSEANTPPPSRPTVIASESAAGM